VLDVGCGPGRVVAALAGAGRTALGIDPSPSAVDEATARGAPALRRSVFDPLPGEGRWGSAVLLDGNVGIGGDPVRLLRRLGALVRPSGRVLVELAAPGGAVERFAARLETRRRRSPWFPWARVPADAFPAVAVAAGLVPDTVATSDGRWFAEAAVP
jgi:SAM-dependent methyltransferase